MSPKIKPFYMHWHSPTPEFIFTAKMIHFIRHTRWGSSILPLTSIMFFPMECSKTHSVLIFTTIKQANYWPKEQPSLKFINLYSLISHNLWAWTKSESGKIFILHKRLVKPQQAYWCQTAWMCVWQQIMGRFQFWTQKKAYSQW